jgi:arginyl-tRNA synthetase
MNIQEQLISKTQQAIIDFNGQEIPLASIALQETRKEFEGEVTIVTFPFIKFSQKSPEETGQIIGEYLLKNCDFVKSYNVLKGFLNIALKDQHWIDVLVSINNNSTFGQLASKNEKVMVEYSSPNTNKPLHLGHVRNNLLGFSLAELLKAAGYDVIKVNLINDRGIHICKSMLAWLKYGNGETPESSGLKGDHLVGKYYVAFDQHYKLEIQELMAQGISEDDAKKQAPLILAAQAMLLKWEEKDPETIALWEKMNAWVYAGFEKTYQAMGVSFDQYYYESNTYLLGKDIIEQGLAKNVFYQKEDQSVWIDLTAEGLDHKLVLRGDGTSVYITQDLGTAALKHSDFGMKRSIYVVGNEQDYHFKVLLLILQKLGFDWAQGLYHLSYGMVDLPSGKMKSREGTVVDADDLIAEMIESAKLQTEALGKINDFPAEEKNKLYETIGLGALKYFLLKVDPKKRLLFDPSESIDLQGNTGPFIQYSYARIQSILRKLNRPIPSHCEIDSINSNELAIILELNKFESQIAIAAESYSPAIIANYVYELAKAFNKFYHDDPISQLDNKKLQDFRLMLCATTAKVIRQSFAILGIAVPERM